MSYFVVTYTVNEGNILTGFTPLTNSDETIELFDTVLAAEEAVSPSTNFHVYDASKFEVPVPLVAPGTPMLVNGQWVVSK